MYRTFPEKSGKRGLERHIQNIHQSNKITDKARAYVKNIFNLSPVTDGTKGEFMERIMKITDIVISENCLFYFIYWAAFFLQAQSNLLYLSKQSFMNQFGPVEYPPKNTQ